MMTACYAVGAVTCVLLLRLARPTEVPWGPPRSGSIVSWKSVNKTSIRRLMAHALAIGSRGICKAQLRKRFHQQVRSSSLLHVVGKPLKPGDVGKRVRYV